MIVLQDTYKMDNKMLNLPKFLPPLTSLNGWN